MTIKKPLVLGAGGVGSLVATFLKNCGMDVSYMDRKEAASLSKDIKFTKGDATNKDTLRAALADRDAIICCLPYNLIMGAAEVAHEMGVHYFDPTEDVETMNVVRKLAETSKAVMVPHCGLAPGFIAIAGASLTKHFDSFRSIELRVGALPQHPRGLLGYAFTWSPEGVVNEYLNDCDVIMNGELKKVPPMEGLEKIVISGHKLEAFSTSGGLGTMCETFDGKVDKLNYKTMRYPGHCELMRFFFFELFMKKDPKSAGEILVNAKPPVDDDVVYIHAAVEGEKGGKLYRDEFVKAYYPLEIDGQMWRAIAWTTAASIVSVVEMVSKGDLPEKGFIKQEDISLEKFLETTTGKLYAENGEV